MNLEEGQVCLQFILRKHQVISRENLTSQTIKSWNADTSNHFQLLISSKRPWNVK